MPALNYYFKNQKLKFLKYDTENMTIKQEQCEDSGGGGGGDIEYEKIRSSDWSEIYLKTGKYECQFCEMKCFKPEYLQYHIESVHNISEQTDFEICIKTNDSEDEKANEIFLNEKYDGTKILEANKNKKLGLNCSKCNSIFKSAKDLADHLELAKIDSSIHTLYTCSYCNRDFYRKTNLENHMTIMHIKKNNFASVFKKGYYCDICDLGFEISSEMVKHRKVKHNADEMSYETYTNCISLISKCGKCGFYYKRGSSKRNNVHECEMDETDFVEYRAAEGMKTKEKLMKGYFTRPGADCMYCDQKFYFVKDLKNHLKENHDVDTEKPYSCKICEKFFRKMYNLNVHNKIYHPVDQNEEENLKILEEAVETVDGNLVYLCKLCKRCIFNATDYLAHRRNHFAMKKFICEQCGAQKTNKWHLTKHVESVHLNLKNHSCDLCNKRFYLKHERDAHRRIHTGEKPYSCEICGKNFSSHSHLATHKRSHINLCRHVCTYCPKKFKTKCGLVRHIQSHTGEKPYECNLCTKSFSVRDKYTRHLNVAHSDIRPFECEICGNSFKDITYLKRHLKLHETKSNVQFRRRGGGASQTSIV